MPRIYESLDNNQANHQALVVEMEGMIANHPISILIDPGSNLSYVAPQTTNKCKLQPIRHVKPWLVQQATGTKRKVKRPYQPANSSWVDCPLERPLTYFL
jgi:hypothetical protein